MRCAVRFVRRHEGLRETLTREVPEGTTLLDAAREAGLPIARACGERALCGRCDLQILEGHRGLSPETPDERETLRRDAASGARRLACQARVQGPVCATAGYW
jgi:2Fe-2S ferredoxin